jgi:hypothetical protein
MVVVDIIAEVMRPTAFCVFPAAIERREGDPEGLPVTRVAE